MRMSAEMKAARAAARRVPSNPFEPGDLVYNTWGYDQTNVDFYVVERATAQGVWLTPVAQETTEDSFMSGPTKPVMPLRRKAGEPTKFHRLYKGYQDGVYVNFEFGSGQKWNGQPVRCSWYA